MSVALETITRAALGLDKSGWRMCYAPDFVAPGIAAVDFGEVRHALGLAATQPLHVLSDLDRTLRVTHGTEVEADIVAHLQEQLAAGLITSLAITTRSFDKGIARFGHKIAGDGSVVCTFGPSNSGGHKKPSRAYFEYVIDQLGIRGQPTLVIGDKVRRDVLGANRVGLLSMLVEPLGDTDLWFDRCGLRKVDNLARWLGNRAIQDKELSLA